ncbi:MAG: DUF4143 domain-containing protein [Propionibacteriaceae bacterium]|jgi:predicted AAA+ superfamily ATPase|nr:DUF4143 domain-containing protein [Propionibacteriaceae bacterium]
MEYRSRVIDDDLQQLVKSVPAIAVVGAKAVGKTESARRLAHTVLDLADEDQAVIVRADRSAALLESRPPVLIDEWQMDPPIWETMRHSVDADPQPGRFLLTGSANPRNTRIHSGAGRVVRVRMRPLSLAERGIQTPTVSLADLWHGIGKVGGTSTVSLRDYADEIVSSGFPAIRFGPAVARRRMLESYVDSAVNHEVRQLGLLLRKPASLLAWLRSFAAATGTTATYTAIADGVPEGDRASRATINDYRDALEQLWLLDQVPAFPLGHNRLSELGKLPKHHLADPALAAAYLGITADSLLDGTAARNTTKVRHGALFGRLFESLATLCVRVYAQASGLDVAHIRTGRGEHEIDLVAHAPDGRVLAFEVKLGQTPSDGDARHLLWLRKRLGDDVAGLVILTTGKQAYLRPDGIAVVPLALLGP